MTRTTIADCNRDMRHRPLIAGRYDPQLAVDMFSRTSESFLARIIDRGHVLAEVALWELGRREHETRREQLLSVAFRNPTPARDLRAGDVISEGYAMRALIRQHYVLPISGQVVLGVSWINVVTGQPEERVHELPPLPGDNPSLHLVTRDLAEIAPYAVPMPASAVA